MLEWPVVNKVEDILVALRWNTSKRDDMRAKLTEARKAGDSRLFALAYDDKTPVQWHRAKDEAEMKKFLDSRDESESIMFNCAIAVVVVNPQDSDETIEATIAGCRPRQANGLGYFGEAF